MDSSDRALLTALIVFLRTSFKGASFGKLVIDECVYALERMLAK